jgi:hypothetical protein
MVRAVKAPAGDFRDADAVRAWATEIGADLLRRARVAARRVVPEPRLGFEPHEGSQS